MHPEHNEVMSVQRAVEEAHRCLLCDDPPCSKGCPGRTDPGKFIRQIRFYNFKGAARTILRNNPLGGVCARVCPVDETCVRECLRSGIDRPIDIDGLQAFAVDYGRRHGVQVLERAPDGPAAKIAVIGGGPAGLTAAALLAQHGHEVHLFEARPQLGGMLRYGVPRARLQDAPLDADLQEIVDLGVTLHLSTLVDQADGAEHLLAQGYNAVFVAPGLWRPVKLELPGMALKGVSTALAFLEQARHKPDEARALVADKNVAIIGGGSVAMDVALCARELGARRIYAVALEAMTELPAQWTELEEALRQGLVVLPQHMVTQVLGQGGQVAGVQGVETEWIEPGLLVPGNARPVEGSSFKLRVGAVIQAVGQAPAEAVGKILAKVEQRDGRPLVDEARQSTSLHAVFAGGDVVRGAGTVVAAVGDGKRAAQAIHTFLRTRAQEVAS